MNHVQFLDTWGKVKLNIGLGPPRELYNGSGAIYTEAIHRLQLSGRMVLGTKEINVAKGVPSQAKIGKFQLTFRQGIMVTSQQPFYGS